MNNLTCNARQDRAVLYIHCNEEEFYLYRS